MPLLDKILIDANIEDISDLIREINNRLEEDNDYHRGIETEDSVVFIGPDGFLEDTNITYDPDNDLLTTTDITATGDVEGVNITATTRLTASTGFLSVGAPSVLTISSGVVTATRSYHVVQVQTPSSPDDLDTINGGSEGDILLIRSDGLDTVTAKDGTGNLVLAGDFALDYAGDMLMLLYNGTHWLELSRSNNG